MKRTYYSFIGTILLFAGGTVWAQNEVITPVQSVNIVKEVKPPIIKIEEQLTFVEPSGNRAIDANEECAITLRIKNEGFGDGFGLTGKISATGSTEGLTFGNVTIPTLKVGESREVRFPIKSNMNTSDGSVTFHIKIDEPNGLGTKEYPITISTFAFLSPMVEFVDYQIVSGATTLLAKNPYTLRVLVQNTGKGNAEEVNVHIKLPNNVIRIDAQGSITLGTIESGESKTADFQFIISESYNSSKLPIDIVVNERYGRFAKGGKAQLEVGSTEVVATNITPIESSKPSKNITKVSLRSDVDKDIPQTTASNNRMHVMIIGNQNYKNEKPISTAINDAQMVKEYCIRTLGVPENQVEMLTDRTTGEMLAAVKGFVKTMSVNRGDHFMFFYFGHGMRDKDENVSDAYLIPVDGSAMLLHETGLSRNDMMKQFESAKPEQLVVYLESCFSGGASGATGGQSDNLSYSEGSSGVRVADDVKTLFKGNIILLTASSGREEANAYIKEGHNVFTYEFLKALKSTQGNTNWGSLFENVKKSTTRTAWNKLRREQTPSITVSTTLGDNWKKWMLK